MAKKKQDETEAKLKKKEYDKQRREKIKVDPEALEKLREKEYLKYLKKKQKGQIKMISTMSSREKRQKRKQWRRNSRSYYHKKSEKSKKSSAQTSFPTSIADQVKSKKEAVAARRKRQLRNRRAILYARISNLEKKLEDEKRRSEKFRKRCFRNIKKNDLSSPQAKVSALLKNVKATPIVKKKLLLCEVLTQQLTKSYTNLKTNEKKNYYSILKPDLLKKNKLLSVSKTFFKHDTCKRSGFRKGSVKMLRIKTEVIEFLEKDQNSRMCPGKNDYIKSKGETKQKRLLCDTMRNLHKKFLTTVSYKLSFATFCRFKPFWITWANIKDRNTCQCIIHANMELMLTALNEHKALRFCTVTSLLTAITCDIYSTKCLFRECSECKDKSLEYFLPHPTKKVVYRKWLYETTSYEKDGKTKSVRKPLKKEINVPITDLVQNLEEALPSFLQHAATIAHQYQTVTNLKKNLTENSTLIHVDFSENYSCKYNAEIQAVHFGGAKQQITLHTGVLYYRDNVTIVAQPFCSLSENIRHDNMAVWGHLKPVFEWLKNKKPNISHVHILSDSPVNQYKNKYMFYMVSCHLKFLYPWISFFSWHYSEPGHGKGAPDGVGGTLKRTADKAVSEGKDITNLNSLKNILESRCPSIILFVVTSDDISQMDKLKDQSKSIATFTGTQKVRQFVFANNYLEFRSLSCLQCEGKCSHFHLGYYPCPNNNSIKKTLRSHKPVKAALKLPKKTKCDSPVPNIPESSVNGYNAGDYVIVKWENKYYPSEIISVFDDGAMVRCMKEGRKGWKWPVIKDEELYHWESILQKIKAPKLLSRGIYSVKEINNNL